MLYLPLKYSHIALVAFSFSFFLIRARWAYIGSPLLSRPWVRIAPHIIDSLLLLSAVALAAISHQLPLQQTWLTAKIIALCGYIILGNLAVKRAPTRPLKIICTALASLIYAYIIAVAVTKSANPLTELPNPLLTGKLTGIYWIPLEIQAYSYP